MISPEVHRFAKALSLAAVALIAAGGLVEALGEGAEMHWSVLAYRWLAGAVALLTAVLAVWLSREDPRAWCRRTAWAAVATVPFPALLGFVDRLAVPLPEALALAALVQIYLGLVLTLAVATSPHWWDRADAGRVGRSGTLHWWAAATTAVLILQNLLGVAVRHTGAGLAIPDFPLAFGGLVPSDFNLPIGLHYAHRVGALVAAVLVVAVVVRVVRRSVQEGLLLPALALGGLLGFQIALGALVIVSGRAVAPNTLHTVVGPVLFAASLALALHAWRLTRPADGSSDLREPRSGSMAHPAAREAVAP
jgi:cytochrome c oxidase assembly protein subunit 15